MFRYRENLKKLHQLFNDRPMSPKALVAYWTDYVVKHNGANHIRLEKIGLPWYQYYLLDIILFILLTFISLVFTNYIVFSIIY